jgi:hypothetical protein
MSDPTERPPDGGPSLSDEELQSIVLSFINAFPEPTDAQVHQLAELLGVPYQDFEAKMYQMFGTFLTDEDTDLEDVEDEVEDIDEREGVEDELDMFLLSFFVANPSPSDDDVHKIADLLGITAEELEERIYRLMTNLLDKPETTEDTDLLGEDEANESDSTEDDDLDFLDSDIDPKDIQLI